jgi:hypothetical protein
LKPHFIYVILIGFSCGVHAPKNQNNHIADGLYKVQHYLKSETEYLAVSDKLKTLRLKNHSKYKGIVICIKVFSAIKMLETKQTGNITRYLMKVADTSILKYDFTFVQDGEANAFLQTARIKDTLDVTLYK